MACPELFVITDFDCIIRPGNTENSKQQLNPTLSQDKRFWYALVFGCKFQGRVTPLYIVGKVTFDEIQ